MTFQLLYTVKNFAVQFLKRKELRIPVPKSVQVEKDILNEEETKKFLESAKENPLDNLTAVYQDEGHLRNEDFCRLTISGHDFINQRVYTPESKSGDKYVTFTPKMQKAYKEYLPYRVTPKRKEDEDKLIIIPKGSHYGLTPSRSGDFIYRHTKMIAAKAGLTKNISPYTIKRSAITNKFNAGVPPKIIQRQSRHKRIEYTMRYDQTGEKEVREYFNRTQAVNTKNLTPNDKARVWLDKLLANEIDLKTFKIGIDVLLPDRKQKGDDLGYV